MNYLAVGLGGIGGAISRYLLSLCLPNIGPHAFPLGTLSANLLGCFCLSFLAIFLSEYWKEHIALNLAISAGFIGSFTTFSTFSLELFKMLSSGDYQLGISYAAISLLGGIIASTIGVISGTFLSQKSLQKEVQ